MILASRGPGDYFGEMALDDEPRSASVMTLEPAQLPSCRAPLQGLPARHPTVSLQLIQNLIGSRAA